MKITRIGMRTAKTVIAVILTLFISDLIHLNNPILAGIAAIMTMESSVSESIVSGKYRMYGTILGGIGALIVSYIAPTNYIVIGISLIAIINLSNYFKGEKAIRMAMIVFLAIILGYAEGDRFFYAMNRTIDTLIGVMIGTIINLTIRPPKVEENVIQTINHMYDIIKKIIEDVIWGRKIDNLDDYKTEMLVLKERYEVFVKDMKYHIGKKKDVSYYQDLFDAFEIIQHHLVILNTIKELPYIDGINKNKLERYMNRELIIEETTELEDLDIIYNYHLDIILSKIQFINDCFNLSSDLNIDKKGDKI